MEKEKKEHVSGRVSSKAIKNITTIASTMRWSFNQTLEFAMLNLNVDHALDAINNSKNKS